MAEDEDDFPQYRIRLTPALLQDGQEPHPEFPAKPKTVLPAFFNMAVLEPKKWLSLSHLLGAARPLSVYTAMERRPARVLCDPGKLQLQIWFDTRGKIGVTIYPPESVTIVWAEGTTPPPIVEAS